MEVRFLTCRFGRSHVHNEFGEPLRRHPRISPSPRRSGVMRGQRREGRNPSVEPERRSCWLRWQPNPPTNSSEEPSKEGFSDGEIDEAIMQHVNAGRIDLESNSGTCRNLNALTTTVTSGATALGGPSSAKWLASTSAAGICTLVLPASVARLRDVDCLLPNA